MSPDRHRGAGGQFTQVGRFGGMTGTRTARSTVRDPRLRDDFPVVARLIYQTLLAKMSAGKEGMPHGDHQSG
jgi:hypothetical protein